MTLVIGNAIAPAAAGVQQLGLVQTVEDSEDTRWRQWKQRGRADDERFRQTLRTVLLDGAGLAAFGGALWFGFVNWL